MQGFPAFRQTGRHADPNLFFSDLLPMVDNLAELKVTLHLFWLIAGGRRLRYARLDELVNDERLLVGLAASPLPEAVCAARWSAPLRAARCSI